MEFNVGDFVVHPMYGVGHIVKVEEKQFSDIKTCRYYKITLSIRNTIWIPVEAQRAVGLRLVTAKKDLDQYRHLLKSHPVTLNDDHSKRQADLAKRLKQGSLQVMCEVVRDLTALDERKRLSPTDRAFLLKARESLCKEWAVAASVSTTEAIQEIDDLLQTTEQVTTVE